ncbi:MAG: iron-containing alcohol dehydrogenase [Clostridia bacterium]|nr:iron-containing alcohol dehydrogenase [Clostridia bacterium]
MFDFEYYNPVNVLFGVGKVSEIGQVTARYGKRALLVSYSDTSFFKNLIGQIHESLASEGVVCVDYFAVTANPFLSQARAGAELCKKEKIDVVIGLGGGSVMDCAKAIAAGAVYPHDMERMFLFSHSNVTQIPPVEALPTVMVPTLAGTGSEMNPTAVITDDVSGKKSYVWEPSCLYPKAAILDPALTVSLPSYQTACGAFDIIAHVIEAYFNGTEDGGLALHDEMQLGVIRAVWETLPVVMEHPDDLQARGVLMWAASIALNGWLTSGTFGFTPMHQMGHVLSATHGATHGATLCCMMVTWLRYFNDREDGARYRKFAKEFFGVSASEAADIFEERMRKFGVQTHIRAFGVVDEEIELLADMVRSVSFGPDGYLNAVPKLSRDQIRDLYRLSL